ncbi:MAG: hypothetical protein DME97_09035 [Verrucomicrobia bacterium]|nr:MAG: hypothetical protein DME97_09035 [Verrucomicrobiota bacterium]
MLNKKSIIAFAIGLFFTLVAFAGYMQWNYDNTSGGYFATWVYSSTTGGEIYFNNGNLVYNGLYRCSNCNEP